MTTEPTSVSLDRGRLRLINIRAVAEQAQKNRMPGQVSVVVGNLMDDSSEVAISGDDLMLVFDALDTAERDYKRLSDVVETVLAVHWATGRLPGGAMHDLRAALREPSNVG